MSYGVMTTTEQESAPGKTLVADISLSALVGSLITLLMFWLLWARQASPGALSYFARVLFSPRDDDEAGMRIILLIPLFATIGSVLVIRQLLVRAASRREWNRALSILILTSVLIGLAWVAATFRLADLIPFRDFYYLGLLLQVSFIVFVAGFILGRLAGSIFYPQKRTSKILAGAITSSLAAALLELGTIFAIALYHS